MLSLSLFRKNPEVIVNHLKKRNIKFNIENFNDLESQRKIVQIEIENLQSKRNILAKRIGQLKKNGEDATAIILESKLIPEKLKKLYEKFEYLKESINEILISLPNLPHYSVPIGNSNYNNKEIRRWLPRTLIEKGGINYQFSFNPKDHVFLGVPLGLDFSTASDLSGSRFSFLRGNIARLHRALIQLMLDIQTNKHGYIECYTPYIVNRQILFGTGQLPKFKEEMFIVFKGSGVSKNLPTYDKKTKCKNEEQYLISTSEITLTNTVRNQIIPHTDLPIKLTTHSPCFRSEAGSNGKDTKGLIRQHQFDKVELVSIVHPKSSYFILEEMVNHVEYVLQLLEIPYRVMLLCTGDMGFCSAKTYDIEVWFPGQNSWREISSISNCEDFQARRMMARFRDSLGKIEYLHTLNGSALAVGRTLAAVLENYQMQDKNILIPKVLKPYMGNIETLKI
ncbi:MAG: serine--tRNA ligase [Bordetella sp.]|nr:MAG: serine--tRNA ligase [Bordetella sp.]